MPHNRKPATPPSQSHNSLNSGFNVITTQLACKQTDASRIRINDSPPHPLPNRTPALPKRVIYPSLTVSLLHHIPRLQGQSPTLHQQQYGIQSKRLIPEATVLMSHPSPQTGIGQQAITTVTTGDLNVEKICTRQQICLPLLNRFEGRTRPLQLS